MFRLFAPLVLVLASAGGVFSQTVVTVEASFSGSTQPVAVSLTIPEYPDVAPKAWAFGRVTVPITVDKSGKVISVGDADGPYPFCISAKDPEILALRAVAIEAAKLARFEPFITDGTVMTAEGKLTFRFGQEEARIAGGPVTVGEDGQIKQERLVGADPSLAANSIGTSAAIQEKIKSGEIPPPPPPPMNKPKPEGPVVNGNAIVLGKPKYPTEAIALRVSGQVAVQVLINEDGNVRSAIAGSGHPLLRRSSEIAACESTFRPTTLAGKSVKVLGFVLYNYTL